MFTAGSLDRYDGRYIGRVAVDSQQIYRQWVVVVGSGSGSGSGSGRG